MKPPDPKDEEIARLNAEVEKLRAERVELLNYILKLDRELQTGEITHGTGNDTSGDQRPQDPKG